MEITYTQVGDCFLPNIILQPSPDCNENFPLGRYGLMHKAFLREHQPILYNQLLLSERLYPLCREVDEAAANRIALGMSESEIMLELVYCAI